MNNFFALHILSFFIGAIPIGFLIAHRKGVNIKSEGSGNTGATNVARVVGKSAGVITLVGDMLKGVLGVCVVFLASQDTSLSYARFAELGASFGFLAILGHCFSPFLGFRGGKGVATSLGVYLALAPLQSLTAVAVFAIVVKMTRFVSLGSISAALAMPLLLWISGTTPMLQLMTVLTGLLIGLRHSGNLQRLAEGTEPMFRDSKSKTEPA